jgi:hypothetical protein
MIVRIEGRKMRRSTNEFTALAFVTRYLVAILMFNNALS